MPESNTVYGFGDGIILKDPSSFYDSTGKLNIIGVIDNNGEFPVDATVGVNVTEVSDERKYCFDCTDLVNSAIHLFPHLQVRLLQSDLSRNWGPI